MKTTTKTCVHNLYYSKQKRGTRFTCLFVNMKRSVEMSKDALVAAIRFTKQRENQEILSIVCVVLFFFFTRSSIPDPLSLILDPRPSTLDPRSSFSKKPVRKRCFMARHVLLLSGHNFTLHSCSLTFLNEQTLKSRPHNKQAMHRSETL